MERTCVAGGRAGWGRITSSRANAACRLAWTSRDSGKVAVARMFRAISDWVRLPFPFPPVDSTSSSFDSRTGRSEPPSVRRHALTHRSTREAETSREGASGPTLVETRVRVLSRVVCRTLA